MKTRYRLAIGTALTLGMFGMIHWDPTAQADSSEGLTEGQILQILHTANDGEITQARLAETKSKDVRVKHLAAMMIADHADADKKGADIARRDHFDLSDSRTSDDLKAKGALTLDDLRTKRGSEFDIAYVDAQVTQHQAVIALINDKLVPNASDEDVKTFVSDLRPAIAEHLKHAEEVKSDLEKH